MLDKGTCICLFDWRAGGHHDLYMRRTAEALLPAAQVVVAGPDPMLEDLADLPVGLYSLGAPRPVPGSESNDELAHREVALLRKAARWSRADHAFHMYADPVLRWLVREPPLDVPLTIAVFHAWAHYRRCFGDDLSFRQRLSGAFVEHKVRRWRSRPDSNGVFALDPVIAARWGARRGAAAHWLPEPALEETPPSGAITDPEGCVFFGALNERKGLDMLAAAIALAPTDVRVSITGECLPGYEDELDRCLALMREAGARVDGPPAVRPDASEAIRALAGARCCAIPYRWHPGTSRVLSEAAAVGTPVVGPAAGLVGHLIREYGLGIAADPGDPRALRAAVFELTEDPSARDRYAAPLRAYTEEMFGGRFEAALRAAFSLPRPVSAAPVPVGSPLSP